MITIEVDSSILEEGANLVNATEQQIGDALTSALRKMRKRIETQLKRRAAQKLRMPQKAISDRFFSNAIKPGDDELKVWIGTWAVSPFAIGSPSQNARGVKVGRRSFPGAFLGKIYSGDTKVWIRLHSPYYSPELYPTKKRPGDRGGEDRPGRFPVVRAAVPIDAVLQEIITKEGDDIAADFQKVLLQELNYQVNVKGLQ